MWLKKPLILLIIQPDYSYSLGYFKVYLFGQKGMMTV